MLSLLLLLSACPSEAPEGVGAAPAAPAGDAPPAGDPGAASPVPGGVPVGPTFPTLTVTPGEGVKISGTAEYAEGAGGGTVRLDVLKKSDSGPMASLVHSTTLTGLGAFEVELPKNYGTVQVAVFVDSTGDGPSPGEPMGASAWLDVVDAPISGVTLNLAKLDPSAGPGAPPAGTDAPPAGTAPGAPPAGDATASPPPVEGSPPPAATPPG